jgi:hypothetical protein
MKMTLYILRELKRIEDVATSDAEVKKIVDASTEEATLVGTGCFLPTLTRDWEYEIPDTVATSIIHGLRSAGYSVDY